MAAMRLLRVSLLVAVALAASGCGTAKKQAAVGGASLVPATAPAFVSIDSNLSSDQWKKVDSLLRKFPGRSRLLAAANSQVLGSSGLDYEKDVKPAVGPELDIVWLDFANGGSNAIVLTQPKDEAKFKALIDKGNKSGTSGSNAVIGKVGDWTVVSDSMAKIDRFRSESTGAKKLADDAQFKDAMGQLPGKSIVAVYAKGRSLIDAVMQSIPAGVPGKTFDFTSGQQPEYIAAALAAGGDGLQFVGASRSKATPKTSEFKSKLLGNVPGDAIMFVSFRGGDQVGQQLHSLQSNPQYRAGLSQLEQSLGVQVAPLLALVKGEVAFYVRPQAPIPEVTLVLEAADEQSALATVDKMVRRLTPKIGSVPTGWRHGEERDLRPVRDQLRGVRQEARHHERRSGDSGFPLQRLQAAGREGVQGRARGGRSAGQGRRLRLRESQRRDSAHRALRRCGGWRDPAPRPARTSRL